MEQSCQRFPCRLRNPSTFGDENFLSVWCQLKKNHAILFVFSRRTSHSPHPFLSQLFLLETWSRPKGQIFIYVKKKVLIVHVLTWAASGKVTFSWKSTNLPGGEQISLNSMSTTFKRSYYQCWLLLSLFNYSWMQCNIIPHICHGSLGYTRVNFFWPV